MNTPFSFRRPVPRAIVRARSIRSVAASCQPFAIKLPGFVALLADASPDGYIIK